MAIYSETNHKLITDTIKGQISAVEQRLGIHAGALAVPPAFQLHYLVTLDGSCVVAEGQPVMRGARVQIEPGQGVFSLRSITPYIQAVGYPMTRAQAEAAAVRWNSNLTPDQREAGTVEVRSEREADERRLASLNELLAVLEGVSK